MIPKESVKIGRVSTRTLDLTKLKLGARRVLSRHVLQTAQAQMYVDDMTDGMIVALDAYCWEQRQDETWTFVEAAVFPSWRHHLVASLPDGFRRRFLLYSWGLDETALARRVEHTVTATAHAAFPDAERVFPPDMGSVARFVTISDYVEGER